jgi:hypothetical protein
MATKRFNAPIEPMDFANMRENGVRSLSVQCHQCRHERRPSAGRSDRVIVRAEDGVHEVRDHSAPMSGRIGGNGSIERDRPDCRAGDGVEAVRRFQRVLATACSCEIITS